jgi:prepilin-type N-terminal cleavage/methylation domain-containing protein
MKNNKGFTLLELLIATAIVGMILPLIYQTLLFTMRNVDAGQEYLTQQQDLNYIITKIRKDINRARELKVNYIDTDGQGISIVPGDKYVDSVYFSYEEPSYLDALNPAGKENFNVDQTAAWGFDWTENEFIYNDAGQSISLVGGVNVDYSTEEKIKGSSRFEVIEDPFFPDYKRLVLYIYPLEEEKLFYSNRAITDPIVVEYSLQYKLLTN